MTYRIVVIDDMRIPEPGGDDIEVMLYTTPSEGLAAVQALMSNNEAIEELWLDHDMGQEDDGTELNIWPVVHWLEQEAHQGRLLKVPYVFIHTSNYPEAWRMLQALTPYYVVAQAELPVKRR